MLRKSDSQENTAITHIFFYLKMILHSLSVTCLQRKPMMTIIRAAFHMPDALPGTKLTVSMH